MNVGGNGWNRLILVDVDEMLYYFGFAWRCIGAEHFGPLYERPAYCILARSRDHVFLFHWHKSLGAWLKHRVWSGYLQYFNVFGLAGHNYFLPVLVISDVVGARTREGCQFKSVILRSSFHRSEWHKRFWYFHLLFDIELVAAWPHVVMGFSQVHFPLSATHKCHFELKLLWN